MSYKDICKLYEEWEKRFLYIFYYDKKNECFNSLDHDEYNFDKFVLYGDELNECVKFLDNVDYEAQVKFAKKMLKMKIK